MTIARAHPSITWNDPLIPAHHDGVAAGEAPNRLGSWAGLMAQAGHRAPADSFVPGDIKTARTFGRQFADTLRWMCRDALLHVG
jgi:NAD(P)H dehydrogenase (quinone)